MKKKVSSSRTEKSPHKATNNNDNDIHSTGSSSFTHCKTLEMPCPKDDERQCVQYHSSFVKEIDTKLC